MSDQIAFVWTFDREWIISPRNGTKEEGAKFPRVRDQREGFSSLAFLFFFLRI